MFICDYEICYFVLLNGILNVFLIIVYFFLKNENEHTSWKEITYPTETYRRIHGSEISKKKLKQNYISWYKNAPYPQIMQTSLKKQIFYMAQNCTIYSRNYDICIILRLGVIKPNCLLHIRQFSIKTLTKVISWIKVPTS